MAITVQDLFNHIDPNKMKFMQANQALMGLSIGSKKQPPNVQIAMPEEVVRNLMLMNDNTDALIVITVNRDEWAKAVRAVKDSVPTESA